MRRVFVRLLFVGLVGGAAAGCSGNGAAGPIGALPNGNGGGSVPTVGGPASSTTAPPLYANPLVIDNGTELATPGPAPTGSASPTPAPAINVYKGVLGTSAKDAPLAVGVAAVPYPTGAPSTAPKSYPATTAGHQVTFSGAGASQVALQFAKTLPNLTYQYNATAPTGAAPAFFSYSTVVAYLEYVPSTTAPPPALASVSVEVTGSDAAGSFDVRVPCTGSPGATAYAKLTCGPFPALGAAANTAGPNPILPGSTLGYDPVSAFAPKISVVLNYTAPVPTTSTGNVLDITDIYATQ